MQRYYYSYLNCETYDKIFESMKDNHTRPFDAKNEESTYYYFIAIVSMIFREKYE